MSHKSFHQNKIVKTTEMCQLVVVCDDKIPIYLRDLSKSVDMKEVISSTPDSVYKANQVRILQ